MPTVACSLLLALSLPVVWGQTQAAGVSDETAQAAPPNETRTSLSIGEEGSLATGLRAPMPRWGNLLIVQPSFAWRRADRWRASVSLAGITSTYGQTHSQLRVKEAWAGITLGDLDVTLGKRILKWGTGYAFTPSGVLDPPRRPTDPTDRLNLNEGRELAMAEYVHGRHALTAAWATGGLLDTHRPDLRETAAVRYNTLVGGFDAALIYAHERGRPGFYGANFTRVVGEAVEVHGELAHRGSTAVLLGGKYTLRCGVGTLFEWYAPAPGAPRYIFFHAGKSRLRELPGWKHWDLGFSLLANTTDRSRMVIFDAARRVANHLTFTGRAELPGGKRWQSEYGMIPYSALLSIGFRYQL
ncbi:MAG: hypothetical protein ABSD56_00965 [Bryobacteraceae bacterium]